MLLVYQLNNFFLLLIISISESIRYNIEKTEEAQKKLNKFMQLHPIVTLKRTNAQIMFILEKQVVLAYLFDRYFKSRTI